MLLLICVYWWPLTPSEMWHIYIERIMYILSWRTVSALTRGLFWCKHQNNTRVSTETVRHESRYIILFLTWHKESINNNKSSDLYTSSPCLTHSIFVLLGTSQSIADDVTMTRQLWCYHVNSEVSYTQQYETSAGCLRSVYPSLRMIQLFGDVTLSWASHN